MNVDMNVYKNTLGWFSDYVRCFLDSPPEVHDNIVLKLQHSIAVAREMEALARSLALDEAGVVLAKTMGLLHDVGRFQQFMQFRTFVDKRSVDHGRLGAEIIENHHTLNGVDENIRHIVCWVLRVHNRNAMPPVPDKAYSFFGGMLRDADKLDIFRITLSFYQSGGYRGPSMGLSGCSRSNAISPAVASAIQDRRMVDMDHVQSWQDTLMLRMSWVFDINFKPTFERLHQRKYLEALCRLLPPTDQVKRLYALIRQRVEDAINVGDREQADAVPCERL